MATFTANIFCARRLGPAGCREVTSPESAAFQSMLYCSSEPKLFPLRVRSGANPQLVVVVWMPVDVATVAPRLGGTTNRLSGLGSATLTGDFPVAGGAAFFGCVVGGDGRGCGCGCCC